MSSDSWANARLALRLLEIDPSLGGLWLRARAGPVRDRLITHLAPLAPLTRLHPAMTDAALLGGVDVTESLAKGRTVQKQGLLQPDRAYLLTMAERVPPRMAAFLAQALDNRQGPVIALDEGADEDEALPNCLADRLAFHVDLSDVALADAGPLTFPTCAEAVSGHSTQDLEHLVTLATRLSIAGERAPLFALRAAKAHARLMNRSAVTTDDIEVAARLVYAHRATQFPSEEEAEPQEQPQPDRTDQATDADTADILPQDLVLEAIKALLPDDLLARVAAQKARTDRGSGSGAVDDITGSP